MMLSCPSTRTALFEEAIPLLLLTRSASSMVFGVFKGMGDLICAAPVIQSELQRGYIVHLLLFPSAALHEFCRLIDLDHENLILHAIPVSTNVREWMSFITAMSRLTPEYVWISPYAPAADSNWKFPLGLRCIQTLYWKKARIVGADTERLSFLFHQRLPVNRNLPLQQREWSAYRLFRGNSVPEQAPPVSFLPAITALHQAPPLYDLVIHPGALAKNRQWPLHKYGELIRLLPSSWKIAILGLPPDIEAVKQTISADRPVEYITGSIRKSIETLAVARTLFVMDSGNMHFAQVLGVPATAVFGYIEPTDIIDLAGYIQTIYEKRFPCQPCKSSVCSQPKIYCLESIEAAQVAEQLCSQWNRVHNQQLVKISPN